EPLVLAMLSRLEYETLKAASPALRRGDRRVGVLLRDPAMADQLALINAVLLRQQQQRAAGGSGNARHRARQRHRGARTRPATAGGTGTGRSARAPPMSTAPPSHGPVAPGGTPVSSPTPPPLQSPHTLTVRGNLQHDLFRLGVVPCAAVALALTGWFTHNRLHTLEDAFDAEGQAVARQVAAMSDLSLYAGDLPALQNVANAALRGGQVTRVEISNSAGVYVTAGPKTPPLAQLRMFTAPVTLREASRASAFAPAGSTAAGDT
ncbi:hypothetical protein ACCD09_31750, partial [Variovorax sp. Varisp62]